MSGEQVRMVGLVGENPASILVVARTLKPRSILLICTAKTAPVGAILKEQLAPVPVELLSLDSSDSLDRIQEQTIGKLALIEGSGALLFDCTGGTKPMLLGVWQALQSKFSGRVRAIYLNPEGNLCEAQNGQLVAATATLTAEEYMGWNRARKQKAVWEGSLSDVPADYLARASVGRMLAGAIGKKQRVEFNHDGWCRVGELPWPRVLPVGLQNRGTKVFGPGDYFAKNGWLEEYCLAIAHHAAGHVPGVVASLGLHVLGRGEDGKEGLDESDVVLVRGSRLVVIEAKAKQQNDGAGAGIHLRAQKTKRFFGSMTRMIFVHPAWGAFPPPDLGGLISGNVTLVGASEQKLEAAILKALGL